jgi:hypothetical protein
MALLVWLVAMGLIYVLMGQPAARGGKPFSAMLYTHEQLKTLFRYEENARPIFKPEAPTDSRTSQGTGPATDSGAKPPDATPSPGGDREPYGDFGGLDDEGLKGYSPCAKVKAHGTFKSLDGRYDSKGRYLLFMDLEGQAGEYLAKSALRSKDAVT